MGTFKTNCAYCGTRVEVDDIYAGSRTQCPGCGQMMDLIPEQPTPPPPPVMPAAQAQDFFANAPEPGGNGGGYDGNGNGYGGDYRGYDDRTRQGNANVEAAVNRLGDRLAAPGSASFFTKLADFLCFRRMIVPSLVIAAGVVSLIGCIIVAIVKFCQKEFFTGLCILLSWFVLRMIYEFFMVLFAINDTLTTIKNQNLRK